MEVQEPSYIKSVQLRPARANAYFPIVKLGERIVLKFDDLEADEKYYEYKIEHYTYDWQLSNISSSVYSDGFTSDNIRDFENSFNTYQNYTHYSLSIPNKNFRLKISGNYLLSVLNEEEEVVFTRKFIVYQPKVDVGVSTHKARKIDAINTKQNVAFIVNHPNLLINNPSQEIKVAIYQNNDWNSIITDLQPQFYRGTQLIYKYGEETTFWGNNEYLFFDSKDFRNATNNIRRVVLKDLYNTTLYVDQERGRKSYTYYPDINGNFAVRSINVEDITLESEYTRVHFAYEVLDSNITDAIYVYGSFNNWQLTDENRLTYNDETTFYETDIILKQGFYNYTYVTVNDNDEINTRIEGSHFQTENEYNVILYYSKFGSRYDEVIGLGSGSSINLQN
ncbi:MAG: DUF5103 domain-containing protein [Flavobacteriaceae bacterium]|nr:DUF5103 domain-containing protein [Flavobacteriaceae bacterium]